MKGVKRIAALTQRLYQQAVNLRGTNLYYVSDKSNWALYWVTHYLQEGLSECGVRSRITQYPWTFKNQVVHFVNRYTLLRGPYQKLHPSNTIFMTWYHGDPEDPNPDMQQLFAVLPAAEPYIKKFVTSCEISRQVLLGQGIAASKIVKLPIGVDLNRFRQPTVETCLQARAELGIPEGTICIGSFQKDGVGWGEGDEPKLVKGPDVFLETIEQLSARYDNLLVLLTGPARGYVKRGLKKLGVPYINHFLDNYFDIVRYYYAIDLYIITSRAEGGPKALMESWATGTPVVSTRVGMPADLIRHGENGMIAAIEDVSGLVDGAMAFIEDQALREQYVLNAAQDIQPYDWRVVAESHYHQLYKPYLPEYGEMSSKGE